MSIEVVQLIKQYGEQKAVNDISFTINKGEVVGFLGPNGAGKSTTMKIIAGYLTQNAGTVKVCGMDVTKNPIAIKKKIGYLPESNPLYYDMYVKEYLQFIGGVHQIKNLKAQIAKTIELTGLSIEEKKKIGQLSKGYKQRVGLAAALIHDPEVLILDEPTSGLDPNQIIEIRNVIKEQGKNKTVLFSSHILQEVQALCDKIIIINKGKIVANDRLNNMQHTQTNKNTVLVEFENLTEEQLQKIQLLSTVSTLTCVNSTVTIETLQPEECRKSILQLSLTENLNIISLHTETKSLEDIFRTLTRKD